MINLENKNIILTGATGGIGNSIVDTLTGLNANLLVTGTNEEKLKNLKNHVIPKFFKNYINDIEYYHAIMLVKGHIITPRINNINDKIINIIKNK